MARATTFRIPYLWWIFATFWLFIFALCAGNTVNSDSPTSGRIATGVLCLPLVAFLVTSRRAGIRVTDSEVVVRRYSGSTVTLLWPDIKGFETIRNGNGGYYLAVRRTNGELVKTQGLAVSDIDSTKTQKLLTSLEALRNG